MKHLLWIAILYVACNNTANTNQTSDPIKTTVAEEKEETGPGACNKLIFFQPGAEIYAKSYDAKGKVMASQLTKVLNVKNEGGMTVAYVESSDTARIGKSTSSRKYNYKCDGKKIYFDIAAMFRNTAEEKNATFEASLMEYPIALSAGQTLPEASGTMQVAKGAQKMTMKYHYKDRKVEGKETITTPAGSWSCYKVTNRVEMEIDIPGMDANAKKMMESMTNKMKTTGISWFSPEFGVVKMEMYQNGKLQSKHEIVAVKR
jgi:hypothetical protein